MSDVVLKMASFHHRIVTLCFAVFPQCINIIVEDAVGRDPVIFVRSFLIISVIV
jgi:hypothetical protein